VKRIKIALHTQRQTAGKSGNIDEQNTIDFGAESSESGSEDDEGTEADKSIPTPGRFESFSKYLFDNRLELALDTLQKPSPEHLLLSYILANGGLDIDGNSWREFL
jgi:hypothetical protein